MADNNYWLRKWDEQDIGFHHDEINSHLIEYFPTLQLPKGARVLVPLCGKSNDMLWLMQQGFQVVGVELSEAAVEAFFADNGIGYQRRQQSSMAIYQAAGITLYQGDMLQIPANVIQPCEGYYDRAALVALPSALRKRYVPALQQWLEPNAQGLLIAYTYESEQNIAPPHSVPQNEIAHLYHGWRIECCYNGPLVHSSKLDNYPLKTLSEQVYHLVAAK